MKPFAFAALLLAAQPALGHDYQLGDLTLDHPMSFETAVTAQTGAGYVVISNSGDVPDRLVGARADFPRVEVHEIVTVDDVMSMRQLEQGLEIPAGGEVALEPGGYHIMFMGLSAPFVAGDTLPVTLVFERAGEIEVMFTVEPRVAAGMGHGDMDHDGADHEEMSE